MHLSTTLKVHNPTTLKVQPFDSDHGAHSGYVQAAHSGYIQASQFDFKLDVYS
jgi:hypothetical protein